VRQSAAATASPADQTRDVVRTQAMLLGWWQHRAGVCRSRVGVAPSLANAVVGSSGAFAVTGGLALVGVVLLHLWVPPEAGASARRACRRGRLRDVLDSPELLRLNFGVFLLHAVQVATVTLAIPSMLVLAGLPKAHHWLGRTCRWRGCRLC